MALENPQTLANAKAGEVVTVPTAGDESLIRGLLDQIPSLVPGVPNSAWMPVLLGQIRTAGGILAGLGFAWGKWVSGEEATMVFWGAVAVVALVWSGVQKIRAEIRKYRAEAVSGVQSAKATAAETSARGEPTPVVTAASVPVAVVPRN